MFLHDYLLACEISTVRTQTLNENVPIPMSSLGSFDKHECRRFMMYVVDAV